MPAFDGERWAPVEGFPTYEVSDCGRVRRGGRLKKLTQGNHGYLTTSLSEQGRRGTMTVHRAVALNFFGPPPDGYQVDHIDHDRLNNRVDNLRWLSQRDNLLRGNGFSGVNSRKTHCGACDLPLSGENLYVDSRGWRVCLACRRRRDHACR